MHHSVLLKAPLLFAGLALANPISNPDLIFRRQEPQSKLVLKTSDEQINYGNQSPEGIIGTVRDHCKGSDGSSCPLSWDMDTLYLHKSYKDGAGFTEGGKLKVTTADAIIGNPEHFEPMLGALIQFMNAPEMTKYELQTANIRSPPCRRNLICKRDDDEMTLDNWKGPSTVEVMITENTNPGNNVVEDSLRLQFEVVEKDTLAGLCGALTGLAAGLGGALNPGLGAGLAFGGLFCIGH